MILFLSVILTSVISTITSLYFYKMSLMKKAVIHEFHFLSGQPYVTLKAPIYVDYQMQKNKSEFYSNVLHCIAKEEDNMAHHIRARQALKRGGDFE